MLPFLHIHSGDGRTGVAAILQPLLHDTPLPHYALNMPRSALSRGSVQELSS